MAWENLKLNTANNTGGSAGSSTTGTPSTYQFGQAADLANMTNYLSDIYTPQAQNSNWAIQQQQNSYNQMQNSIGDYVSKYNAQQDQLNALNNQMASGYNQNYGSGSQLQGSYDALTQALQNIQNGVVPQATQDMIQQRYDTGMAQTTQSLQDQYSRQQADLLDNLGARGVLNSTTSQGAVTGLGTNMLKALQDASQTYGIEQINALLAEPYKQYEATQGLNTAALNQANSSFGNLLNMTGSQYQLGQSALDNLSSLFNMQGNAASVPSNIYNQTTNAAQGLWNSLLGAETARLTSGQASGSGSSNSNLWGAIGSIIGGLF